MLKNTLPTLQKGNGSPPSNKVYLANGGNLTVIDGMISAATDRIAAGIRPRTAAAPNLVTRHWDAESAMCSSAVLVA